MLSPQHKHSLMVLSPSILHKLVRKTAPKRVGIHLLRCNHQVKLARQTALERVGNHLHQCVIQLESENKQHSTTQQLVNQLHQIQLTILFS